MMKMMTVSCPYTKFKTHLYIWKFLCLILIFSISETSAQNNDPIETFSVIQNDSSLVYFTSKRFISNETKRDFLLSFASDFYARVKVYDGSEILLDTVFDKSSYGMRHVALSYRPKQICIRIENLFDKSVMKSDKIEISDKTRSVYFENKYRFDNADNISISKVNCHLLNFDLITTTINRLREQNERNFYKRN